MITGRVVSDDGASSPIRRASVTLNPSESPSGKSTGGFTAITEDDGRFTFSGVRPGRYHLTVRKTGYLRASFGATRPGRPGTPIVVGASGAADYVLRLAKGAVITGTIVDAMGDPAARAQLEIFRVRVVNGARLADDHHWATTDDRGVYRVHSLPPGEYIVSAAYGQHGQPEALNLTSTADVQWAERQLRGTRTAAEPPPARERAGYAPAYFPGTVNAGRAQTIVVSAGEERSGVDFMMPLVPMARVDGTVAMPDGKPAPAMVFLVPADTTPMMGFHNLRETGGPQFSFGGLTPGTYTLLARSGGSHEMPFARFAVAEGGGVAEQSPRQPPAPMWATTTVTVGTVDVTDVALALRPALEVTGRVVFDAATGKAPDAATAEIRFTPIGEQRLAFSATADVDKEGRFRADTLMPGRYLIQMTFKRGSAPSERWRVRSIAVAGRPVPEVAFDVSDRSIADVSVTVTDRVSALRGTLSTAGNQPAPDFYVIAFPADQMYWTPQSARVQAVRPATDGAFLFESLAPGEYLLAALTDVEQEEWFDPAFLAALRPSAIAVKVVEGTTTTQNVRIAR